MTFAYEDVKFKTSAYEDYQRQVKTRDDKQRLYNIAGRQMTQLAQNSNQGNNSLDKLIYSNIASALSLNSPQLRIDFLSIHEDDEFLTLQQAADYCKISKRTIQRHRDIYQFPNMAVGRNVFIKRHVDFYLQYGAVAWYEVIAKHISGDITAINQTQTVTE